MVTINGVDITTSSTGSVTTFPTAYTSCGLYKTDPNSLWVGVSGSFAVDFLFDPPVNDLIIVINATGQPQNENFIFTTDGGPVTITEANSSCFSTIVGNEIISGAGASASLGGGGWFQISSPSSYSSMTLSGDGGANGSLLAICEATIELCEAVAGDLSSNSPVCPNSTIDFEVTSFNDNPEYTELLLVVDENGIITEILNTTTGTLSSSTCTSFTIYSYNYETSSGSIIPVVGDNILILDCTNQCCDLESLEVEFADNVLPAFPNAPGDLFLDCIDDLPTMSDQTWVDNCDGIGTVNGTEFGNFDFCLGGTLIRSWTYMDYCGNVGVHLQTITIAPLIAPAYIDTPINETVDCNDIPQEFPDLEYTNGMEGSCLIEGSVSATIIEDYNACGGTIEVQWLYLDICSNLVDHYQFIEVGPSPEASFIDEPIDITVSCENIPTGTTSLAYTNNSPNCLIEGTVEPVVTEDLDDNSGLIVYTWEFIDDCGRILSYSQTVTVESDSDYSDILIRVCDDDTDGILLWDSLELQTYVNIDPTEQINYYPSLSDAKQQTNALLLPYSNRMSFTDSLYATITKSFGCNDLILLEFIVNPKPEISVDVFNEKCFGDHDGSIEIINFTSEANYSLNGTEIDSAIQTNLEPDDYQIIMENQNGCGDTLDFSISPGMVIESMFLSWNCNDSSTSSDSTDDFYTIEFELSNSFGLLSGYTLTDQNQNNLGTFSYDNLASISIPANGEVVELLFTDNEYQCTITQTIGPLIACSTDCMLIIDVLDDECQDNGTPTDPSDDLYLITLEINAENGSSANSYNVAIDGILSYTFLYDELISFSLPADSSTITLTLTDAEDQYCLFTEEIGPLVPCSNDCELNPEYQNIRCDNNGTDDNNEDDIFYFDLEVSGLNVSSTYSIIELGISSSYDILSELGPFNISDGSLQLTVVDDAEPSCSSTINIDPPMTCSDCNQTIDINDPDEITCNMPEVELIVTTSKTAIFQWTGPGGFNSALESIMVNVPGTYNVFVSFDNGCTQTASVEVTANNEIPMVFLGPDKVLNCQINQVTLDASNSIYPMGAQFEWSDETGNVISTDLITIIDQAGTYFFVIENPITGCNSIIGEIEVIEDYDEPLVEIVAEEGNIINCFTESVELTCVEEPNAIYTWIINDQSIISNTVTVTESTEVTLISIDTISGCENSAEFNVENLTEYPIIILEQIGEAECESGEVCIDGSNSPFASNLSFDWYNSNGNLIAQNQQILCVTTAGDYTLELTDENNGCKNSESISISTPIVPTISLPEIVVINSGAIGLISVNIDDPMEEIAEIIWSPFDVLFCNDCIDNQILNPGDGLIIEVEVISISGCSSKASSLISIEKEAEVYIPNAINPNSTSGNQLFTLFGNEEVERIEEFSIYDRWGNLIFNIEDIEPNNSQLGWDGTFNGKEAEQGVYVYRFRVLISSGGYEEYVGTLTLLK